MATLSGLDKLWILFLEELEVALSLPGPDAVGGEDEVHFFECALVGFWVQSPNHGDSDNVGSAENVIGLLVQSIEHVWEHHGEPAVAKRPANNTPGVALCTDLQGEDLSRVEPGYCEPGGTESGREEEDHSNSTVGVALGCINFTFRFSGNTSCCESASAKHCNTLDNGAPVESPSPANPVESEDADECGHHVCDGVETRNPLRVSVGDTSSTENGRSENCDTSDTNPLLHDLKPDDKLHTTAGVKFAGSDTEEHVEIRLPRGRLALKLSDVADILKFSLSSAEILTALASKTSEDVAGFLLPADFDQPTGGFREEPYDGQEYKQKEYLEGDGESPGEGSRPVLVFAATKFNPVGDNDTEDVQCEFYRDELATARMFGCFSRPNWNDGIEHTSTPAIDQASCCMLVQILRESRV